MNDLDRYVFWLEDYTVLYRNDNYLKFIPTKQMTRVEQLNSITLFLIYVIVMLIIVGKIDNFIFVPLICIGIIVLLFKTYDMDEIGKKKELLRLLSLRKKEKSDSNVKNKKKNSNLNSDTKSNKTLIGYIDSNNNYVFPKNEIDNDNIDYDMDDIRIYDSYKCRKPNKHNPFMNKLVSDYNLDNEPFPCNIDDEKIKNKINDTYNDDIFKGTSDLMNKRNSDRQFYTVFNSTGDRDNFVNWCYKKQIQ
jgi:hypothetical protein